MKLRQLHINRLPGIYSPFEIRPDGALFQVILGPNAIGKSSLCRAVEALYWSDRGPSQQISVNGEFELEGEEWWVAREGARIRWRHNGEDSAAPGMPASHTANCFFLRLRDLTDPAREGVSDVASEIRRQMSGGFDLRKIREDQFENSGPRLGRSELTAHNKADQAVQCAKSAHEQLRRRENELKTLGEQLAEADSKQKRLHDVKRALSLLARSEELKECVIELETLPRALADLTGGEVAQIEKLQEKLEEIERKVSSFEGRIANAEAARSAAGLKEPLDEADVGAWRGYADELREVGHELNLARSELSGCHKETKQALSAIGGGEVDETGLTLADHGELFEFLREAQEHRQKTDAIKERSRLLSDIEQPVETQGHLENIRAASDALRLWLRSADLEPVLKEYRRRRIWLIVAGVLIIIGALLAIFLHPIFSIAAGIGVGIALPVLLRDRQMTIDGRQAAQDAFGKCEIEGPASWSVAQIEARLRELDSQAALLDAKFARARDRDVERQTLVNQLNGLAGQKADLDIRREKLQNSLKLDAIRPDADLVDFARALDQLRLARGEEMAAAGKAHELETQHDELLSKLSDALERLGEPRPADVVTARSSLERVVARNENLRQANSDLRQANEQLAHTTDDLKSTRQSISEIYSRAGLENGDLHGLTVLLGSLERYTELKSRIGRLENQNELDLSELDKAGEAKLAEVDRAELERLSADCEQSAGKAERLHKEIADINAETMAAKRGHVIEDLIAARDEALLNLHECRTKVLYESAGRFLIDSVEREYEKTQLPRVFERARNRFSVFTNYNYELQLGSSNGAAELLAKDLSSGEPRNLEELSDGTRAQLLLAARIAFAEEVENGKTLPLFLDEALDQSDPARYEAIVRSLGRVAAEQDRQIFYLTSDPADVGRIQHALTDENCDAPSIIDLGLIRNRAESVRSPAELKVDPRPQTQRPDGLSADEYGAALNVSPLNPSLGYTNQHFFHVLWDDLDLLHQILDSGIVRVGQWKLVQGSLLADKIGSYSKSPDEIARRADLLENFCELWRQGRGQPVDRDILHSSQAVTDRFIDGMAAMAEEFGGDAQKLLNAIRSREDERVSGFRKNALEKLEQYFLENGYIDNDPILTEDELRLRALASPAANQLPEGVANECLNRWWTLADRTLHSEFNT